LNFIYHKAAISTAVKTIFSKADSWEK
jgi:hypothetical protein